MRAITLRHPSPWAICYLGKDVENVGWCPPSTKLHPGDRLAIHGGRMPADTEIRRSFAALEERGCIFPGSAIPSLDDLRTQESSIVAVVTYGGALTSHTSKWFAGYYGWLVRNLVVLPQPVPCRGARGLWSVPAAVLEQMRDQFRSS